MFRYGHLPIIAIAIILFGVAVFTAVADRTMGLKLVQECEAARRQGHFQDAELLSDKALTYATQQYGAVSARVAEVRETRGALYADQHKYDLAESEFTQARVLREDLSGIDSPEYARICEVLGVFYTDRARYAEAESCLKRALSVFEALQKEGQSTSLSGDPLEEWMEAVRGPKDPDQARILSELGWLYSKQGQYAQAESSYKSAMAIREKVLAPNHAALKKNIEDLRLLDSLQRKF